MDTALKQRLIGAAVLVVLAVIFLPMLLDGTRGTGGQAIPLELPAPPAEGMRTEIVPLPLRGSATTAPAPVPADEPVATVDANAPVRVDALSGQPVGGGRSAPAAATESPTQPPQAAVAPPPAAGSTTPAPAPTSPAAAGAASERPLAVSADGGAGRFFVNFGSYGQPANASRLVAELERIGIAARAEPITVDGAPATRVRAGPYADRPAAEAVRQRARAARSDLEARIVEGEPVAAGAASGAAPARGFAVQIGAFADEATANARREQLRQSGFTAFVDRVRTEQGVLWRVRVGPEIERAEAERLREALKSRLGFDGQVVIHP